MYYARLLVLFIVVSQIFLMFSTNGLIIVIPLKVKFPLKTLLAYGVLKAAKKKFFRSFFKIAKPFGLRRTDTIPNPTGNMISNHIPHEYYQPEQLFQYLSAEDKEGCLKRMVCEVHATNHQNAMNVAENIIVDIFGKMSPQHNNLPSFEFHQAATIGHKSKDPRLCQQYYSNCPYSSQEIMQSDKYYVYYPSSIRPP